MNSNVKQAQKEGATVEDISAGLAYSVIKNALFKVIKLAGASDLGNNIVVQGGTFLNKAVLRAFEKISGANVICPDISGIMGAFGAALIAKDSYTGQKTSMLSIPEILALTYTTSTTHCNGCSNKCMLTINTFSGGRRYITGNRCEKGLGAAATSEKAPNLSAYKLERIFDYPPLENPARGEIGIPRVLNMYENYPFWATFLRELGLHILFHCGDARYDRSSPRRLAHVLDEFPRLEVIAARHLGMRVLGLSCMTNKNLPDCMAPATIEEIVATAEKSGVALARLLTAVVTSM